MTYAINTCATTNLDNQHLNTYSIILISLLVRGKQNAPKQIHQQLYLFKRGGTILGLFKEKRCDNCLWKGNTFKTIAM